MDETQLIQDLVEITFPEKDDFLKIRETLSRIGVASRKEKELFQSCHILHKKGKYYIVHFKELFKLDGKETNFDESDLGRRNTIIDLLRQWNLVKVLNPQQILDPRAPLSQIKVIAFKEKNEWDLETKYNIGKKREVFLGDSGSNLVGFWVAWSAIYASQNEFYISIYRITKKTYC